MHWRQPATWIALASALLVVVVVWFDRSNTSPGRLAAVHAQDPRLADQDCELCHGETRTGMAAACGGCHAEIASQIALHTGLHGTFEHDPNDCAACHSEHRGEKLQLVTADVFARAGVADVERFDHAHVAFGLAGRHGELACSECHRNADVALLAVGDKRYLGLTQACVSCHEDPHAGKLPDCASCHGQERPFAEVARFEHTRAFPLEGAHAGRACTACHADGSEHALEAERVAHPASPSPASTAPTPDAAGAASTPSTSSEPAHATRTCVECHASPHRADFLAEFARVEGLDPASACASCHPTTQRAFDTPSRELTPKEHALTGFALDAPHDRATCAQCHRDEPKAAAASATQRGDANERFAAFQRAFPGRSAEDCAACHGDPHAGEFADGAFARAACTECHARVHFLPPAFGLADHARTSFALTGAHAALVCSACHRDTHRALVEGAERAVRTFSKDASDCRSCHADVHAGRFDARSRAADADCERCHTTETFEETAQPFDHAGETAFALDGAHARAECSVCHVPRAQRDEHGRRFGRVDERFAGDTQRCETCHADVHAGAFAKTPAAAIHAAGQTCDRCHTTETFTSVPRDFDHGAWTGFALAGAHARAACETCHERATAPDALGRAFGRSRVSAQAATASCASCHADVHNGAFDGDNRNGRVVPANVEGRTSCARCHTQDSFSSARPDAFDHALWTGFALDGAHARVACASCHEPVLAPDGSAARFGLARGAACADCHVDPHVAQFAERGRTDCARCHASGPDFHALRFDHARDSRFALDDTHKNLDCAACHRPAALPDGTSAVRYKPLGTECGDCHAPGGGVRR